MLGYREREIGKLAEEGII
jgi:hypothetical protein